MVKNTKGHGTALERTIVTELQERLCAFRRLGRRGGYVGPRLRGQRQDGGQEMYSGGTVYAQVPDWLVWGGGVQDEAQWAVMDAGRKVLRSAGDTEDVRSPVASQEAARAPW